MGDNSYPLSMPTHWSVVLAIGVGVYVGKGEGARESVATRADVVTDPVACIGLVPTMTPDFKPWDIFPGAVDGFLAVEWDWECNESGLEGGFTVGMRDFVVVDDIGFTGEELQDRVLVGGRLGCVAGLGEGLRSRGKQMVM